MAAAGLTHAAYLPVQPLGQDDGTCFPIHPFHLTWPRHRIQLLEINPLCHPVHGIIGQRTIHRDNILLFMSIATAHDFIHQVALVCHEQKAL